jgi:D-alanyl-D-alanine endopeptidase (penicillin-binding protein 7)
MKNCLLSCCLAFTLLAGTTSADQNPLQLSKRETGNLPVKTVSSSPWASLNPKKLNLRSSAALVMDQHGNQVYARQANMPLPIASITKLMTAMVILDASLPLDEPITIAKADRDLIQLTASRLETGARLTREQMLRLALMASENKAANALARTWPEGEKAFIKAMNRKAKQLGMQSSRFADPAGLDPGNIASAQDLAIMVRAALKYPLIREATTTRSLEVRPYKRRGELRYVNTNRLMKNKKWTIEVSKTGYLNEAGRCLVMQVEIANQPMVIVLLNSFGKLTPYGDSSRIRKWIEAGI